MISPPVRFGTSGAGAAAWFGWPDIPQLEKLIADWVRATDQAKRKRLADEIKKLAREEGIAPSRSGRIGTAAGDRVAGQAVLLVSVELDEILDLADRIPVMHDGRLVGDVPQAAATERAIELMMAGAPPG